MGNLLSSWDTSDNELDFLRTCAQDTLASMVTVKASEVLSLKSPEEWHAEQVQVANRHLQNAIGYYQNETKNIAEVNETLDALEEAFKEAV
jgi:uncharacterized protein (UPF0261 family)